MTPVIECIAIFLLILINGLFAFAEFSIISAKKARLQQKADRGDPGAAAALAIGKDPTKFLSAIQIGVTLVGILVGAAGVATLSGPLADNLASFNGLAPYSTGLSVAIIVLATTYLTLVFGELVPKRIALSNAEKYAAEIARPMRFFAFVTAPVVLVISHSTEFVLRLFGIKKYTESPVTEDEIRVLIEQGTEAGVFKESEADMVAGVFDLDNLRTEDLMTRRLDIIGLDINDPPQKNWKKIQDSGRSYFPVYRDTVDNLLGIVSVKDLWTLMINGRQADLASVLQKPFYVPESMSMLRLLESFRKSHKHIAIVLDEYGSVQGIIAMTDILKVIVGYQPLYNEPETAPVLQQEDGSWLVDGTLSTATFKDLVKIDALPEEEDGYFHTLAGFVMTRLQRIPVEGDSFEAAGFGFRIVQMDGKRIAKIRIRRLSGRSGDPQEPDVSGP